MKKVLEAKVNEAKELMSIDCEATMELLEEVCIEIAGYREMFGIDSAVELVKNLDMDFVVGRMETAACMGSEAAEQTLCKLYGI